MVFGRNKPASSAASPSSAAAAACSELRAAYQECFDRWYAEKFAKGQWQKDDCAGHWHKYRACLEEHLEDKHLRQILLESETSSCYAQLDPDSSSGQGVSDICRDMPRNLGDDAITSSSPSSSTSSVSDSYLGSSSDSDSDYGGSSDS